MDRDMLHRHGHVTGTRHAASRRTCTENIYKQHRHRHAASTWSMDMDIQHGHGHAAWPRRISVNMDIDM
jgi:hypothetical protein